jgi:uncharacterized membrane protein
MATQVFEVAHLAELDNWIRWYQAQGFGLRWYQPPLAILVRPKRLSAGWLTFWLLVGWILIWIPLFIYLILYAVSEDDLITIRIHEPPLPMELAVVPVASEDAAA